jgi:hypothetical protein
VICLRDCRLQSKAGGKTGCLWEKYRLPKKTMPHLKPEAGKMQPIFFAIQRPDFL